MLDAFDITERVAVLELDLDRVLGQRAEAGAVEADQPATRRATSTWRSCSPTTSRPRSSTRRSARAPARCSSTSSCSTCTAAPGSATGRRSLAYRLRLQAPDRNLTDADVADVRAKVTTAAAKLGAELRG